MWPGLANINFLTGAASAAVFRHNREQQPQWHRAASCKTDRIYSITCLHECVYLCLTWSHCSPILASPTALGSASSPRVRGTSVTDHRGRAWGWDWWVGSGWAGEGWEWDSGKAGCCKTVGCGDSEDCAEGRSSPSGNAAGRWHTEVLGCKLGSNVCPGRAPLRIWLDLGQVYFREPSVVAGLCSSVLLGRTQNSRTLAAFPVSLSRVQLPPGRGSVQTVCWEPRMDGWETTPVLRAEGVNLDRLHSPHRVPVAVWPRTGQCWFDCAACDPSTCNEYSTRLITAQPDSSVCEI